MSMKTEVKTMMKKAMLGFVALMFAVALVAPFKADAQVVFRVGFRPVVVASTPVVVAPAPVVVAPALAVTAPVAVAPGYAYPRGIALGILLNQG
jgi:hypothetical protein